MIVSPSERRSTISWLSPAWRSSGESPVRHRTTNQSLSWAPLVHTLVPFTIQPPSTRVARVRTAARSLPASGSLMPIANDSSPRQIGGRNRCFCSSLPKRLMIGPV